MLTGFRLAREGESTACGVDRVKDCAAADDLITLRRIQRQGTEHMAKQIAEMRIETVTMELPDVKTIRLQWPEGYDPGEFKTGQFITLYWPHKTKYKRAYSLSSCSLDRGFYEVTVKRDGKMGTSIVDWAEAGDAMFVIPPVGKFLPVFDPPGRHLVCVAGGSGVTPFRGFVREATRRDLDTRITILYTVRTTADIIFEKEFRELEAQNPRFKFHVTCTRLAPEDPWTGRRGRVTPEWVKSFVDDPAGTVFYACGTNAMVEGIEHLVLHDLGLPKEQMKLEKWG
jgi:glycine betaine catabolism B